jgi:hypothetical protein
MEIMMKIYSTTPDGIDQVLALMRKRRLVLADLIEIGWEDRHKRRRDVFAVEAVWGLMASLGLVYANIENVPAFAELRRPVPRKKRGSGASRSITQKAA